MKSVVAIVLAVISVVAAGQDSVSPLRLGLSGLAPVPPLVLPSYYVRSSVVNHGLTIPRVVVPAPIIRPIVSAPIVTSPIVNTPIIPVPVQTTLLSPSGLGLGGLGLYKG